MSKLRQINKKRGYDTRVVKCVHEFNQGIGQARMARCVKCRHIVRVAPIIMAICFLVLIMPSNVYAWDLGSFLPTTGQTGGYYAGQQDAIYDHNQGLNYNPNPMCCHSVDYQDNFRQGYDQQWNSYQSANVYVNNSPGAQVTVGQNSDGPRYNQQDEGWSGGNDNYQPQQCCLPPPPPPSCGCGCC